MDFDKVMQRMDIESDVRRIENVLSADIFRPEHFRHPLRSAAFTELIICLNDLLQKAKDLGEPVTFRDDIPSTITRKDGNSVDITDFVAMVRNAVCHVSSGTHFLIKTEQYKIKSSYDIIFGKRELFELGDGQVLGQTLYDDDFCFNFGKLQLYFHRHIIRSFEEARHKLLPLISSNTFLQ
jgi:hypothetical protein